MNSRNTRLSLSLDDFWGDLLSRDPQSIEKAYKSIDIENREIVENHLRTMATEEGWHVEQVKSAQIALKQIEKINREN